MFLLLKPEIYRPLSDLAFTSYNAVLTCNPIILLHTLFGTEGIVNRSGIAKTVIFTDLPHYLMSQQLSLYVACWAQLISCLRNVCLTKTRQIANHFLLHITRSRCPKKKESVARSDQTASFSEELNTRTV